MSQTILVMEDEDIVRHVASRALKRQGYTVLEAANGTEALRVWKDAQGPVDLILADLTMPDMSGQEAIAKLASVKPLPPILYMSGHAADLMAEEGSLDPSAAFIQKPFKSEELCAKIREVLDSHGVSR